MAEWPEYPRNRNDTIELSDESDEEDAAAEEEMFDAAAEVPDTTATPPRPPLPRLAAHLHRRLQSQLFLPQKRLQSKPHSPDDPSGPLPPAASSAPDATVSEETISDCDDIFARATWVSSSNREEFEDRMACMKLKPGSPLWRMYAQEHIEAERVHAGELELDPVLPEKVLPPSGAMPAVDTVMHANLLSKRKINVERLPQKRQH